jgi:phosphoribosylformylglycinamidine cyclo-ligase
MRLRRAAPSFRVGGRPAPPLTYRDAGVDRDRKDAALAAMGARIRSTHSQAVLEAGDPFGALFRLSGFRDPVLVTSIDGVGTKVRLAEMTHQWRVVGADIVSHGANDVLCQGAQPLFMLDYIASSALVAGVVGEILEGMIAACRVQRISLIGGETAEMPGVYAAGGTDIVGCTVGVAERDRVITGDAIRAGDVIIGLASDGLHTNGYSLARAALLPAGRLNALRALKRQPRGLSEPLGAALLRPHRPYARPVLGLREHVEIRGIAHVTGGGIPGNLVRILPSGCRARITKHAWPLPPLFALIQKRGNVSSGEMFRTFNMGIGLVLVVPAEAAAPAIEYLDRAGERAWAVGTIVAGSRGVEIGA